MHGTPIQVYGEGEWRECAEVPIGLYWRSEAWCAAYTLRS